MERTIVGEFDTRRGAELAVEHLVQQCGVARSDVFVAPAGSANTTGSRPSGPDAKTSPAPAGHQPQNGAIEVSVDVHGDDPDRITTALKDSGATTVRIT